VSLSSGYKSGFSRVTRHDMAVTLRWLIWAFVESSV